MNKRGRYMHFSKTDKFMRILWLVLLPGILIVGLLLLCSTRQDKEQDAYVAADKMNISTTAVATESTVREPAVQESSEYVHNQILVDDAVVFTTVSEPESVETTAAEETAEVKKPVVTEVSEKTKNTYSAVLDQYREMIMMDSAVFLELRNNEAEYDFLLQYPEESGNTESIIQALELPKLRDRYPLVDGSTLTSFHYAKADGDTEDSDPSVYHYAYYNIDGRRSDELLIGAYCEYRNDYSILAIYTSSSDEPRLLQSIRDDGRWHLTVYTDGTYCMDGSGGASLHYWDYYRIDGMFDLDEKIASFTINYNASRSEYLSSVISGYEDMLAPVEDIIWHPLLKG